jgi:hypothetical protein
MSAWIIDRYLSNGPLRGRIERRAVYRPLGYSYIQENEYRGVCDCGWASGTYPRAWDAEHEWENHATGKHRQELNPEPELMRTDFGVGLLHRRPFGSTWQYQTECTQCGWRSRWRNMWSIAKRHLAEHLYSAHD